MNKFEDIVNAAASRSAEAEAQAQASAVQKAAYDKVIAETKNLSPEVVAIIDQLLAGLTTGASA